MVFSRFICCYLSNCSVVQSFSISLLQMVNVDRSTVAFYRFLKMNKFFLFKLLKFAASKVQYFGLYVPWNDFEQFYTFSCMCFRFILILFYFAYTYFDFYDLIWWCYIFKEYQLTYFMIILKNIHYFLSAENMAGRFRVLYLVKTISCNTTRSWIQ